jgi:hypothetical protein
METNKKIFALVVPVNLAVCFFALAPATQAAKNKTIKDLIVKSTDDSDHTIKAVNGGHTYTITVDTTSTKLYKSKSGHTTFDFSDVKKGDVLQVKGSEHDRDVTATEVRDLSMTKSATMYGVVSEINSSTQTVKIETLKRGEITVAILKSTSIKYNGKKRAFKDILKDDKVLITGTWNHDKETITKTKKFYILIKNDYDALGLDSPTATVS